MNTYHVTVKIARNKKGKKKEGKENKKEMRREVEEWKRKEGKSECFMFIYISELLSSHPANSSPTFLIYRHPI